jgi:2-keto-4-pentenoate hydratase/2-oxohepta-3-ene-1,7-dioic acid hydratase in catechol pathway
MRLVNVITPYGERVGALRGGSILDLQAAEVERLKVVNGVSPRAAIQRAQETIPSEMMGFLESGPSAVSAARHVLSFADTSDLLDHLLIPQDRVALGPIVPRPSKLFVMRGNYIRHRQEMGGHVSPTMPDRPRYFLKPPTTVIGHGDAVIYPRLSTNVHHEIELAVVIGKPGRWIPAERVDEHLAGYTILLDMTARDFSGKDDRNKSFDTFAPIGPCLVPPQDIGDPNDLTLTLRVNGDVRQHGSTRDLEFKIPQIVSFMSEAITLLPGDVISTGTPEGVGPVHPGDVIEAEIENIGVLRCPVEAESAA